MASILIFENDNDVAVTLKSNLERKDYDIKKVNSPIRFPQEFHELNEIDLFIIDLMMGDDDLPTNMQEETCEGLITGYIVYKYCVLQEYEDSFKSKPLLILTGLDDQELIAKIKEDLENQSVLYEFFKKPLEHTNLLNAIERLLKNEKQ